MKLGDLLEISENQILIVGDEFRCGFLVNDLDVVLDDQQKITAEFLLGFNQLTHNRSIEE